jgi:hypothetical protein
MVRLSLAFQTNTDLCPDHPELMFQEKYADLFSRT